MSTDVDWQHELDGSFGTGHDLPPGHYVAAGRTAVRRRRRASALVAAASVLVAGGAVWATAPDPSARSDAPVASDGPTPRVTETPVDQERDAAGQEEPFFGSGPATLDDDGLVLAPGAGPVLERVQNPMGYTRAEGRSLAIRVMFEGREHYSLLVLHPDGGTSMGTNDATGDFPGWLAGRVATQRSLDVANGVLDSPPATPSSDPSSWLTLQPDGDVVPGPGVVLLEEDASPRLGDVFAPAGARTGAVVVLVDERPQYAAYRVVDNTLDVVAGPGSFDSLSAFLGWAREQYASGEGMR